jgi:hypothetical protein
LSRIILFSSKVSSKRGFRYIIAGNFSPQKPQVFFGSSTLSWFYTL